MLAQNATLDGEIEEGIAHILPSLVIAQDLDFSLALVLSKGLEHLEGLKCLGLGLQRHNKVKSRVVVDESDPVLTARHGDVAYIMDIAMNEFQRSGGAPRRAREGVGMHLTSQAGFTNGIRGSLRVYDHTSDQVAMKQGLDISQVMVGQPSMPQIEIQRNMLILGVCAPLITLCDAFLVITSAVSFQG